MRNQDVLRPFFEAELQYQKGMEPSVSTEGRISKPLGSGTGAIKGEQLRGNLEWTIFEIAGNPCETNIVGNLTTPEGERIELDSKGFGLVPDTAHSNAWKMSAAVKFSTKSARYQWLNGTIALWDGTFDSKTGKYSYRAYQSQTSGTSTPAEGKT